MTAVEQVWRPAGPQQFVDQRSRLTRDSGLVHQNVRAWHGVVVRQADTRKQVYDACPHAHSKQTAAKKCAEAAARRLNRALARGETWPLGVGR